MKSKGRKKIQLTRHIEAHDHAEILRQLGRVEDIADHCGIDGENKRQTVYRWIRVNQIPVWHWDAIIEYARLHGIQLSGQQLFETSK